jgi:hypothetical protein
MRSTDCKNDQNDQKETTGYDSSLKPAKCYNDSQKQRINARIMQLSAINPNKCRKASYR